MDRELIFQTAEEISRGSEIVNLNVFLKGKTGLADKVFLTRWRKPLRLTAMTPCVKGKKCFVGWRACEP